MLRPEAAKDLRRLQGGLWNVNEVLPLRGELRDWLVAEIERAQPVAFSGDAWLNDTADRVQFLLGLVNRMSVPPPLAGRPVALPPELMPLIQRIWRDILGRRRSRTVDIEDHIPRGPLIDFTKACLGLVGIKLGANAINSHFGRSKKGQNSPSEGGYLTIWRCVAYRVLRSISVRVTGRSALYLKRCRW